MIDPKRIERINDLVRKIEGDYPYHAREGDPVADADEAEVLDDERAICRAAAEISRLTAFPIYLILARWGALAKGELLSWDATDEHALIALRHFAELANGDACSGSGSIWA